MRRTALSWGAVGLGSLLGLLALARFGMAWLRFGDSDPGWLLRWISYVGGALLGLVFITASMVALRNRKRAGFIFLLLMPVSVFCLAYPSAGYLVWHSDGGGWFVPPEIPTAIGLTVVFFLPIFTGLLALRRGKCMVYLFGATMILAAIVFGLSHWTKAFLPTFGGWSALFLLFGIFWIGTYNRGWSSLLQPRSRSLGQRVAAFLLTCIVVLCVDVGVTFGLSALGSSLFSGDCKGKPLLVRPESQYHAVFTARVIFVGRSMEALTREKGLFRDPHIPGSRDPRVGDWAVGVVQEKFWGLPSWSRLVLLTNFIYWKDATYFIDGARGRGLLTRVLPIVEGRVSCSRTKPALDAIIDLRALHELSTRTGTRLLGYVQEPETFVGGLTPPTPPKLAVGARIRLSGPTGTKIISTDQSGVFQEDNLPPGDYTLQLLLPDDRVDGFFPSERSPVKLHVEAGDLLEENFQIFWNGRIEGRVEDSSGKPAHLWVMLVSADGASLPGYVKFFLQTNADGSYSIDQIPPGRYVVLVNPDGPYDEWPYDIRYYPGALRLADANVFDLSKGQRVKGIDFKVQALRQRTVQVRVRWADGKSAPGAHICVAYERTKEYESLEGTNGIGNADQAGDATIHLYGNSRVRVFAEQFVDNPKKKWFDTVYSHPVESQVDKMPDRIDLVLTSEKP